MHKNLNRIKGVYLLSSSPMKVRTIAGMCACVFFMTSAASAQDTCINVPEDTIPDADLSQVRNQWLDWNNRLRERLDLPAYILDDTLNTTAMNWAAYSAKRGTIDHKRSLNASYYDYKAIEQWFSTKGVQFNNRNGATFTENIGWDRYSCTGGDCTQKLINAIHSTFNFYLSENGKKNRSHWNSLVKPEFTKIGIGIAENAQQKRYYLVVHYAADMASGPVVACKNTQ